jgi:DnaJ-class molecular chaperone
MTYVELKNALQVLGLVERASLKEIRSRHRELVKRFHPDAGAAGDEEKMQQVNAAYEVVQKYLAEYRYCFSEEEFLDQNPEQRLWQQFYADPIWGRE